MLTTRANKENASGVGNTSETITSPRIKAAALANVTHARSNSRHVMLSPSKLNALQVQPQSSPYRSIPLTGTPAVAVAVTNTQSTLPPPAFAHTESRPVELDEVVDHMNQSLVGRDEVNALQCQVDMLKQQLIAFELMDQTSQKVLKELRFKEQEMQAQIEKELKEKDVHLQREESLTKQITALQSTLANMQATHTALEAQHAALKELHSRSTDAIQFKKLQATFEALNQEHTKIIRQQKVATAAATHVSAVWTRSNQCAQCTKGFTFFSRRHHCRSCGDSVCAGCSTDKAMVCVGSKVPVRACKGCIGDSQASKAQRSASAKLPRSQSTHQTVPPPVAPAAPPMAPPMAPPCAPPMAPPISSPAAAAAALASPSSSRPSFTSPRAPSTASRVSGTFDPSALTSVTLRPAPTPSKSKPAARDSILADIKNFQLSGRKASLRTPARTIAKTTSPNASADGKTPRRKSPADMMSLLRSRVDSRRAAIEHGSDHKGKSARRGHVNSAVAVHAAINEAAEENGKSSKVKRLSFAAPVAAAATASDVATPVAESVLSPSAASSEPLPVVDSTPVALDVAAVNVSTINVSRIEDVEDGEWEE